MQARVTSRRFGMALAGVLIVKSALAQSREPGRDAHGSVNAPGFGVAAEELSRAATKGSDAPSAWGRTTGYFSLGPIGRWWDDKHYVKLLHLRQPQQKQMDAIFDENRSSLINRYQELQDEEELLDAASRTATLNEGALFAAIERVAQARAELQKANLHLLLDLRKEMDADQLGQLAKQP